MSRNRSGKRGGRWGATSALLLFLAAPARGAVVDQQQLLVDPGAPAFRVGGATDQELAQTATAGLGGRLVAVRLPVSCTSGSLILEIRSVAGGGPSEAVLAAATFSGASLPPATPEASFPTLSFFSPATVAAGERFAVVLRSSGTCSVAAGPLGNPYPRGSAYYRDQGAPFGVWSLLGSREDLPFQTLVEPGDGTGGGPATEEDDVTGFVMVRCFLSALDY